MTTETNPTAYTPDAFALEMIAKGVCFECPCGEPMYTAEACFTCRKCRVYAGEDYTPAAFDYRTGETTIWPPIDPALNPSIARAQKEKEAREAARTAGLTSGFGQLAAAFNR